MTDRGSRLAQAPESRSGERARLIRPTLLAWLVVSFCFNVAALVLPFVDIDMAIGEDMRQNLFTSVKMMWDSKLYLIAVLIVGFSIIFPFIKLGVLLTCQLARLTEERRTWLVKAVGPLGKWSFLDIFVVAIILTLTNDQFFIEAKPLVGVYCFIVAIGISMIVASRLEIEIERREMTEVAQTGSASLLHGIRWWAGGFGLIVLSVLLLMAFTEPFVQIDQFLMGNDEHSLLLATWNILGARHLPIGLSMLVFLAVIPVLQLGVMSIVGLMQLDAESRAVWTRRLSVFNHWSMLDVFALALVIFAAEGEYLMKTDKKMGHYLILFIAVVLTVISALIGRWSRQLLAVSSD